MGSQIIPRKQEFIRDIRKAGVLFTPYTINSLEYVQNNTRKYGIDGYYTDFMWPSKWLLAQF
jgi:hypothetical protein